MTTRGEAIAAAARRLSAAGVPDPQGEARRLCRWAGGLTGAGLAVGLGEVQPASEAARFESGVAARAARRPFAQISGVREFHGNPFKVTADVLDPRPETETLVDTALECPARRVLDLGTGSGCILLSLLGAWPEAEGVGTDVSQRALQVARENAALLGLAGRARFAEADWFEGVAGRFDLIVANPPYIPEGDLPNLAPEVRLHEPRAALTPGGDGTAALRAIAAGAPGHLVPGGRLLVEIGPGQAAPMARFLLQAGLDPEGVRCDFDIRERVVVARSRT